MSKNAAFYTYRLLESVGEDVLQSEKLSLVELYARIKELLDSDRIREIRSKNDEDARFGHKTANSTFFGFKSHCPCRTDTSAFSPVDSRSVHRHCSVLYRYRVAEPKSRERID